jgi:transcriptional regulator with XRE-family HTH domain
MAADSDPGRGNPRALAERVARRAEELGLSTEDLARKAGMAPAYLRRLAELGGDFDMNGVRRLAGALGMTYHELLEGRADAPPGQGPAAARAVLARLTTAECWDRLGNHGVGRVALPDEEGPLVLPVNYLIDAHRVVYRTAEGSATVPEPGARIAFEADRVGERGRDGWSVLVRGTAEHVTDPGTVRRYAVRPGGTPWAGGVRELWVRITPALLTGRVISVRR